jgi:protein-S-isoprenylcysteine O-methyltransferase Ste14
MLTFRLALGPVITGIWFGTAVLAEGGLAEFFSHRALIGLTVILGLMVIVSFCIGGNFNPGVQEDRSVRWVIAVFAMIILFDAWLPAWSDHNDFWVIENDAIRWVGVTLFAIGAILRLWPVHVLGDRFSGLVAIQPNHTLETGGIYRIIRNPSYLGMLTITLGWGLAFRSVVGVALATLLIPPLMARMDAEEALLLSRFGKEYEAYRARTWRLIPGVW